MGLLGQASPASTGRSAPVIPPEASDARKCTAWATSSAVAISPKAVSPAIAASAVSGAGPPYSCLFRTRFTSAAVAIGPGASALTRTPRSPRSSAAARAIPITACLEAV